MTDPRYSHIQPRGEYVLVEVLPLPTTAKGLLIPDIAKFHGFRQGKVLKTGDDVRGVSVGDAVAFPKEHLHYGTSKTIYNLLSSEGAEVMLLKWYDLVGVVVPNEDGSLPEIA